MWMPTAAWTKCGERFASWFRACAGRGEEMAIQLRSAAELEKMYRAGQGRREVLNKLRAEVKPGATTMDLERTAERLIALRRGKAACEGDRGYLCASAKLGTT